MQTPCAVAVYGGGPRLRSISARIAANCGWPVVAQVEDRDVAVARLAEQSGVCMLLDARCSLDPLTCTPQLMAALTVNGNVRARARRPGGETLDAVAGLIAANGQALARGFNDPSRADGPVIGTWTTGVVAAATPALAPDALTVAAYSHAFDATGYAVAARNLLIGLRRNGIDVGFQNHWSAKETVLGSEELSALQQLLRPQRRGEPTLVYRPVTQAGGIPFLDMYRDGIAAGPLIACTMFECDTLPPGWVAALERCEAVWVPSTFGKESFVRSGVAEHRVHVVPIGIDLDLYVPDGATLQLPNQRRHTFLSVFEWGKRKGPDILLAAWARAFGPGDDVTLYIRTGSATVDGKAMVAQTLRQLGIEPARCAPISILPDAIADSQLASLFRSADAFILPTRGEGFCLPYVQAMAMGVPVIGVGYGGSGDFLDASTGFDIPTRIVPIDAGFAKELSLYSGQRWAEPDIEATVSALRAVVERPGDAAQRAANAFVRARHFFGRDVTGAIAARALAALPSRSRPGARARFTLSGPVTAGDAAGAAARALLQLAQGAGIPVSVEAGLLPMPVPLDEYDELRIAAARERIPAGVSIGINAAEPQATIQFATRVPPDAPSRAAFTRAEAIWAPSAAVADELITAGFPAARVRILGLPIDTGRNGPDNGRVLADASIVRYLTVVDLARTEWHAALAAYIAAFDPPSKVSLTFLFLDPPSAEREARFQSVLTDVARGRTGAPPLVAVEFQPDKQTVSRERLGMHDAVIGPATAPWPVEQLIASAGIARIAADVRALRDVAVNPLHRARLARRQRRLVVAQSGITPLARAFEEALDECIPFMPPSALVVPIADDVLYVIAGAAAGGSIATIEASRALEGSVVVRDTQQYVALIPAGAWLSFGWDLRMVDALRRRFDADAVAAMRSDDPAAPDDTCSQLGDTKLRETTAHQFMLKPEIPRRDALPSPPRDTVVLARTSTWQTGIERCVVTETTVCHVQER